MLQEWVRILQEARGPTGSGSSQAQEGQEAKAEERRLIHIDWAALGVVTVVSIVTSVIFTILLASGIRLVSAAKIKSNRAALALWSSRSAMSCLASPACSCYLGST